MKLIALALLRDASRHPWQPILTVISIALAVAVVIGIDLANQSALSAFERANRFMDGNASHRVIGGPAGLDETVYTDIKVEFGLKNAAPVIIGDVGITDGSQRYQLMGIDPLSDFRIRNWQLPAFDQTGTDSKSWPVFVAKDSVLSSAENIELTAGSRSQIFQIAGTVDWDQASEVPVQPLLVTDIAWAQDFFDMGEKLSHIEIGSTSEAELRALQRFLPETARLMNVETYNSAQADMTYAFRTNLTALSLLALVIAIFLVFSAVNFQTIRRRAMLTQLQLAGATSSMVAGTLVAEVLVLATLGVLLGLALGAFLANLLVVLVTDTINALYYSLSKPSLTLNGSDITKAFLLGYTATAFATGVPLWLAHRTTLNAQLRRSVVEHQFRSLAQTGARLIIPMAVAGGLCILWPTDSILPAFAGLFLIILSFACLTPTAVQIGSTIFDRLIGSSTRPQIRLGIRNATANLSRTGVATVALSIAVAASLGVSTMIVSFRTSVDQWLQNYLRADVYLGTESTSTGALDDSFLNALNEIDGVSGVSKGQRIELQTVAGPLILFAVDTSRHGFEGFQTLSNRSPSLWENFQNGNFVLISEPLSRRLKIGAGDSIAIPTDRGVTEFQIGAVYRDYSTDRGLVTVSWKNFSKHFDQPIVTRAALYLDGSRSANEIIRSVNTMAEKPEQLFIRSNKGLRELSLELFDQTFRITDVLKWLALLIAVAGILSALMALQLERFRQFASLRAIGFDRGQLFGMVMTETTVLGIVCGFVSVPLGLCLALTLIKVVNLRSFHWTMQTVVDPGLILQAIVMATLAAAISGIYPAVCMFRRSLASDLRHE
ncbi:MAG: FtsX-like permease family protein [Pseudomonadota bacterium]